MVFNWWLLVRWYCVLICIHTNPSLPASTGTLVCYFEQPLGYVVQVVSSKKAFMVSNRFPCHGFQSFLKLLMLVVSNVIKQIILYLC